MGWALMKNKVMAATLNNLKLKQTVKKGVNLYQYNMCIYRPIRFKLGNSFKIFFINFTYFFFSLYSQTPINILHQPT